MAIAQGVPYTVEVDAPRPLEKLLETNLDLVRWRGNPRLDLDQLQRLVKAAPEQARTLVATEGYYSPKITAGLDTSGGEPVARVLVEPGPPVLVGDIELILNGFAPGAPDATAFDAAALRQRWSMPVGAVFRQADWEQAKRNLLRQVMQSRYPRARLVASSATVDPDTRRALLRVEIDSGPDAKFGGLRVEGLRRYPLSIVTNLNQIKPGQEYSEAALQAFQSRIQDTGYFSGVEVSVDMSDLLGADLDAAPDAAPDANADPDADPGADAGPAPGAAPAPAPKPAPAAQAGPLVLPVLVRVTENKAKHADIGLGLSSNTGGRAQVSYDDLNVFGLRMKSNVLIETKRQAVRGDFYWPTTVKGYNDSVGVGYERTDLAGEVANVFSVAARRAWGGPLLERSLTLELLTEQRDVAGLRTSRSRSMPLTYSITRRALDNLLLPTKGYVINAQLGGALLPVLTDERFVRASARGIYYRPLGPSGGLIVRGEAGALGSKQKAGVPGTFLFRAGGDQSVRGYGFQELGVREGDAIVGGRYLLTGGVEYNHWFKPAWGAALFLDAGNAADKLGDLKPEIGYGVGARWRSPVGPINIDAAYGQATKKFRLHFSLGFTF
ncbi:autotransporter assembly complex protein TamA [Massilia glaciei]|uniref:autotransporter assembly complex protein TamA n=1 Tax=Massilia glaciei TaxID=1524097 RepID=UPI0027D8B624|nr:BamA/TamA family outer membrane protein [Massilia glaciei]